MDFPIVDLMDPAACYQFLVDLLHPDGLHCPRCQRSDGRGVQARHRAHDTETVRADDPHLAALRLLDQLSLERRPLGGSRRSQKGITLPPRLLALSGLRRLTKLDGCPMFAPAYMGRK